MFQRNGIPVVNNMMRT